MFDRNDIREISSYSLPVKTVSQEPLIPDIKAVVSDWKIKEQPLRVQEQGTYLDAFGLAKFEI